MDEPRRSARDDDPGQSPWSRPRDVPPTEDPPAQDAPAAGEPTRRLPTYSQDPAAYVRGPYERGPYERGPYERGPYERGPYERGPQEPYEHQTGPMPPSAFGSPAYAEPGFPVEPEKTGRRHSVALVGTVVAGVCLLLIGLGGGYLVAVGFDDSGNAVPAAGVGGQAQANRLNSPQSAPGPGSAPGADGGQAPSAPPGEAPGTGSSQSSLGGGSLGDPDPAQTNAAIGVVASIDGDTFFVRSLDGNESRVSTDTHTYFATVRGTGGISKLAVGDLVFVGGTDESDGSMSADMVLGGAFPDLGAGTR